MAKWNVDIKSYTDKKVEQIKDIHKKVVFACYSSIVKNTPSDTGRARGNWIISESQAQGTSDNTTGQRYHDVSEIPITNYNQPAYIENNLPYIRVLEYGGYPNPVKKGTYNKKTKKWEKRSENGFSKKAPQGMVGLTVAKFDSIVKSIVKEVGTDK
jgi:hypothetical protein